MTCYSVLAVTPTSEDWIPYYLPAANGLVAKHGGKYLARTATHERLEGSGEGAALRIILECPSEDAAKAFMANRTMSPIYRPVQTARTAITS